MNFLILGLVLGARPSDEFLDTSYEVLRKRIALGGYRLAELLKRVNIAYERKITKLVKESSFLNLFEEDE